MRIDDRRTVVELGSCLPICSWWSGLYLLDCTPFGTCRTTPSLPFRRAATTKIRLNIAEDGVSEIIEEDKTLTALPRLASSSEAFVLSLVKLLLITLAAMVPT